MEGTDRGWDESYSTDSGMHSLYVTDTSIDNTHNTSTNEPLDLWNFYQKHFPAFCVPLAILFDRNVPKGKRTSII